MRVPVTLLSLLVSLPLQAAPPLRIEASYEVLTRNVKIAEIHEQFVRTGNHYRIESLTRPVRMLALFKPGTLRVISEGEITDQGLRPERFLYLHSHDTEKNAKADFDWAQSTLILNHAHGQRIESLPVDTQDRISALYQFRYLSFPGERKEVTMHITNGSKLDKRQYLVQARQTVDLPLGKMEAIYLSTPPQATPWKTELWLSAENGNFPCKIVLTEENGEKITQVLTSLSITQ